MSQQFSTLKLTGDINTQTIELLHNSINSDRINNNNNKVDKPVKQKKQNKNGSKKQQKDEKSPQRQASVINVNCVDREMNKSISNISVQKSRQNTSSLQDSGSTVQKRPKQLEQSEIDFAEQPKMSPEKQIVEHSLNSDIPNIVLNQIDNKESSSEEQLLLQSCKTRRKSYTAISPNRFEIDMNKPSKSVKPQNFVYFADQNNDQAKYLDQINEEKQLFDVESDKRFLNIQNDYQRTNQQCQQLQEINNQLCYENQQLQSQNQFFKEQNQTYSDQIQKMQQQIRESGQKIVQYQNDQEQCQNHVKICQNTYKEFEEMLNAVIKYSRNLTTDQNDDTSIISANDDIQSVFNEQFTNLRKFVDDLLQKQKESTFQIKSYTQQIKRLENTKGKNTVAEQEKTIKQQAAKINRIRAQFTEIRNIHLVGVKKIVLNSQMAFDGKLSKIADLVAKTRLSPLSVRRIVQNVFQTGVSADILLKLQRIANLNANLTNLELLVQKLAVFDQKRGEQQLQTELRKFCEKEVQCDNLDAAVLDEASQTNADKLLTDGEIKLFKEETQLKLKQMQSEAAKLREICVQTQLQVKLPLETQELENFIQNQNKKYVHAVQIIQHIHKQLIKVTKVADDSNISDCLRYLSQQWINE